MRKHSSGIDSTRTRSLPSKLDCKRARVWVIQNNTIHLKSGIASSTMFGVRGEELVFSNIVSNVIDKQSGAPNPDEKRAISLKNCSGYIVACNDMDQTEYGLHFEESCPTLENNDISSNNFHDHTRGIVFEDITLIGEDGEIGNDVLSSGNKFLGTTESDLYTKDFDGSAIKYYRVASDLNEAQDCESNVTDGEVQFLPAEDKSGCEFKLASFNIEDYPSRVTFMIYPNPTMDFVYLVTPGQVTENPHKVEVYDLVGRAVYTGLIESGQQVLNIDCRNLSQGIYFITVEIDDRTVQSNKLVMIK